MNEKGGEGRGGEGWKDEVMEREGRGREGRRWGERDVIVTGRAERWLCRPYPAKLLSAHLVLE